MTSFKSPRSLIQTYCRLRGPLPSELQYSDSDSPEEVQNLPENERPSHDKSLGLTFKYSFVGKGDSSESNQILYLEPSVSGAKVNELMIDQERFNLFQTNPQANSKIFEFDHIFHPKVQNAEIYNKVCNKALDDIEKGLNSTILVAGSTQSGKQHLLRGEENKEKGMILLCIEDILKRNEPYKEQGTKVEISIFGLYKNQLFDLLANKAGEEEEDSLRKQQSWLKDESYKKEKILVPSAFKHLYRKSLNNLKIYSNLLINQLDHDISNSVHIMVRIALSKYEHVQKEEKRGFIDFIKLASVEGVPLQTDMQKLFYSIADSSLEEHVFRTKESGKALTDAVLFNKNNCIIITTLSTSEKTAKESVELLKSTSKSWKEFQHHSKWNHNRNEGKRKESHERIVYSDEQEHQRVFTPTPQKEKQSLRTSATRIKNQRSSSVQLRKGREKGNLSERKTNLSTNNSHVLEQTSPFELSSNIKRLKEQIYQEFNRIMKTIEKPIGTENQEELKICLEMLRLKLHEKDELHEKVERVWKNKEISLVNEIQEGQQTIWQLREELKKKSVNNIPKRNFPNKITPRENRLLTSDRRSNQRTINTTRSLSANSGRNLSKNKTVPATKEQSSVQTRVFTASSEKPEDKTIEQNSERVKQDREMIAMLKDNNRLQTDILNNLKEKFQKIEMENSELYTQNRQLKKVIDSYRLKMKEQESVIATLQCNIQELKQTLFDENTKTSKKAQSASRNEKALSTSRSTHPISKREKSTERNIETMPTKRQHTSPIKRPNTKSSPVKKKEANPLGFKKEINEIKRLKQELQATLEDLETEKSKTKQIHQENVKLSTENHDQMNFINKFEKQLDRVQHDQSKQLGQAEDRLTEFKEYIETLKNENKNLLETQSLLMRRLNESKGDCKTLTKELKKAEEENKDLEENMRKVNEKMMLIMKEQSLNSETSSDLAYSGLSSRLTQNKS